MKPLIRTTFILISLSVQLFGVGGAQELNRVKRVMTWVPPYGVEACRERLDESFDGIGMAEGLTHLGLQFWRPTRDGGCKLVGEFGPIDESTISEFRKWGDEHGVRTMLCIYNGTPEGWDWELAKSGFDIHRERLVKVLVAETVRLKLDGVDIDFEGKGRREGDREAFVEFIKELSVGLHAKGKELTIDTFAYQWNAPNQGWWAELLPHVDGLQVMGYAETGAGAADWRSYDFVKAAGGVHSSKLLIGVLSSAAEWQKKSAEDHLEWFGDDGAVGLAIWDAQLKAPVWRSKEMWQTIARIRGGAEQGKPDPEPAPGKP